MTWLTAHLMAGLLLNAEEIGVRPAPFMDGWLHEAFFHQREWGSEVDRSLQHLKKMGHSTVLGNVMPVQGWIPAWSERFCGFRIERRIWAEL
jgi:hypothetical protein